MRKRLKERITVVVSFLLALTMLIITASLAWLAFFSSEIDASSVGGQLLTNYFHSGKGTQEEPFVITRPIHYYNLVNLYQKVADYSDKRYYFQVGKDELNPKDPSGFYVYNYDDFGNLVDGTPYSKELNLSYYNGENALLPIGTHDKNFLGHFNGNGLTISGFTVSTLGEEKDCDIGIFGYVGQGAEISNVYFSDVTIDLSNVTNVISSVSAPQTHNAGVHTVGGRNVAYAGYIAGHVMTNSQFSDVYINNTSIIGGGVGTAATSGFAYFGCIESTESGNPVATLGESFPKAVSNGIGMKAIYDRLRSYRGSESTRPASFVKATRLWVNGGAPVPIDGDTVVSVLRENDTLSSAGAFSFSKDSEESEGDTVYLTGKRSLLQTVTTLTVTDNEGFYLTNVPNESGNTFLKLNDNKNGLATTTDKNEATVWDYEEVENGVGYYFTTEINETEHRHETYYITAVETESGCSAVITTTATTQWTYNTDNSQMYCTIGETLWYLAFEGDSLGGTVGGSTKNIIQSVYGGTTYYLKVTGTNTITATTNEGEATQFKKVEGGFWIIDDNDDGNNNSTYLNYSNSKVAIGSTQMTWSYINNQWIRNGQAIQYNGTDWKLQPTTAYTDFNLFFTKSSISGNNFFLKLNAGGSLTAEWISGTSNIITVPEQSTVWTLPADTSGKIYATVNNVTYYLKATNVALEAGSTSRYQGDLVTTTSEAEASVWTKNGNNYLSASVSTRDSKGNTVNKSMYIRCTGTGKNYAWSVHSSTGDSTLYRVLPLNSGDGGSGDGDTDNLTTTAGSIFKSEDDTPLYQTVEERITTNPVIYPNTDTWFPILANGDGTPSENNYGYVISGMQHMQEDFYRSGDIWVTESNSYSIAGSYFGGEFTHIYTVNGSGIAYAEDAAFSAYSSAKERFGTILNTNIYGLLFKSSDVSAGDKVTASVSILGNAYENYELPRHCVNINLEEDGILNLFAGDYYTEGEGFFSLYHILRNENHEITENSVKKISKIYKEGDTFHYLYSGEEGIFGGELVFDSAWMTDIPSGTRNRLFYFEIPVMAGEYALGSAEGGCGAYLLYLDVAKPAPEIADNDGWTEYNFKVDFRSTDYIGSADYVAHSLLQFAIDAPAVSAEDFSVAVSYIANPASEVYSKGLYTITVTNKTGIPIDMTVFLCDDDGDSNTAYSYAYRVVYTNGVTTSVLMNGTKDYFQKCAILSIP